MLGRAQSRRPASTPHLTGPMACCARVQGIFTDVMPISAWPSPGPGSMKPESRASRSQHRRSPFTLEARGDETELELRHDGFPNAERAGHARQRLGEQLRLPRPISGRTRLIREDT
jgi:hypothetical protein